MISNLKQNQQTKEPVVLFAVVSWTPKHLGVIQSSGYRAGEEETVDTRQRHSA